MSLPPTSKLNLQVHASAVAVMIIAVLADTYDKWRGYISNMRDFVLALVIMAAVLLIIVLVDPKLRSKR